MAQPQSCTLEMANYISGLQQSTKTRKVTTFWKSMMLANPASRLADAVSNSIMAGAEIAKSPIATGFDRLAGRRTGIRTRMFSADDLGRASWDAVKKTPRDVKLAMQGIDTFQGNRTMDMYQGETQYDTPLLNAITKTVFRLTQASDRPFKRLAFERSLREQARILGTQAGMAGPELDDFIARTLPFMPDENVLRAYHDAEVATFADSTPLSNALSGLKRGISRDNAVGELAVEAVFPFTKVPSNAAHRVGEYSGLGLVLGYANLRRAFKAATNGDISEATRLQQYAVDQMGRGSAGIGALMVGWWLAERNMVTLGYPATDPKEAGLWEATGKQDYSIRIGGRFYSVKKMAPFGPLLVVGAYAQKSAAGEETGGAGQMANGLVGGLFNTMADQPAFGGARQIEELRRDPAGGAGKWVERTAASFIPPVIARWAAVVDPVVRETKGGDGLTSLLQGRAPDVLQARIPYASRSLPARHDVLGGEVPREGNFFLNFLDPFNSKLDRSTQDEVRAEMDRLGVGITRMKPAAGEDREMFYRRREAYGIMLRGVLADVVQSDEYQSIAEARRWMAENVPGISPAGVERQIREEQRAFLEQAATQVRSFFNRERKAGKFTGDDNLPLPEERDATVDRALRRTGGGGVLNDAEERAKEIDEEDPAAAATPTDPEFMRWRGRPGSQNVVDERELPRAAQRMFEEPFVTDTLAPLVEREPGDRAPVMAYRDRRWAVDPRTGEPTEALGYYQDPRRYGAEGADTVAVTRAGLTDERMDPMVTTVPHEFGHAFDARGMNPQLVEEVKSYYPQVAATMPEEYAAVNEREMFAESFAAAVNYLREWPGDDVIAQAPDVVLVMQRLLDKPVFRNHPMRDEIKRMPVAEPMVVLPAVRARPPR